MNEDDRDEIDRRFAALEARIVKLEGEPAKKQTKAQSRAAIVREQCNAANAVALPLSLSAKSFQEEWGKWCKWRTTVATTGDANGKKANWTPISASRILATCEKLGPWRAIEAIRNSIDRWLDLYEPEAPSKHGTKTHSTSTPGDLNAGRYARRP